MELIDNSFMHFDSINACGIFEEIDSYNETYFSNITEYNQPNHHYLVNKMGVLGGIYIGVQLFARDTFSNMMGYYGALGLMASHLESNVPEQIKKLVFEPMRQSYQQTFVIEVFFTALSKLMHNQNQAPSLYLHLKAAAVKEGAKMLGSASYNLVKYYADPASADAQKAWNKLTSQPKEALLQFTLLPIIAAYNYYNPQYKITTPIKHMISGSALACLNYSLGYKYKDMEALLVKFALESIAFSSFVRNMALNDHAWPYMVSGVLGNGVKALTISS